MIEQIVWSPGVTLDEIEKQVILCAFRFFKGNKTQTAQALGIAVRTLDNKFTQYEMDNKTQEKKDADRKADREAFLKRARGIAQTVSTDSGDFTKTHAGFRVESTPNVPTKPTLSVSERPQVQTVLPKQAATGTARSRR